MESKPLGSTSGTASVLLVTAGKDGWRLWASSGNTERTGLQTIRLETGLLLSIARSDQSATYTPQGIQ